MFCCAVTLYVYIQVETPISTEHDDRYTIWLFFPNNNNVSTSEEDPRRCSAMGKDKMYAFGSEIYDFIGETELRQYIRFTKDNPLFNVTMKESRIVASPESYDYNITALSATHFVIEERVMGTSSRGGSCFIVRSDSMSTQICNYEDFFNGTYLAYCPLPECSCRNVSISLEYTNFTAYAGNNIPLRKLLWRQRVCNNHNGITGSALIRRERITATDKRNIVTWYYARDKWVATFLNGRTYEEITFTKLCSCIKNIRKLFMIGASHMRYKADYIISTCYRLPLDLTKRHSTITVENVHYLSLQKIVEYSDLWDTHLRKEALDGRDVIMVQTGAHDMVLYGLHYTMDAIDKQLVGVLNELHLKSFKYGFKFIALTTPPYPEVEEALYTWPKKRRNNFAIAAINRRITLELVSRNVDMFDEFGVLLAQQDNNVCGCHYICRETDDSVGYIIGKVGITAATLMFSNNICG